MLSKKLQKGGVAMKIVLEGDTYDMLIMQAECFAKALNLMLQKVDHKVSSEPKRAPETPTETAEDQPTEEPTLSIERAEVMALASKIATKIGTEKINEINAKFGVESLANLAETHLEAYKTELERLEAEECQNMDS